MDNNPNPYQFQGQSQQEQSVPPPPPSQDAQIGVRTMQSDLDSIKQSGGEAPQSQIINAPELAQANQYSGQNFIPTPPPQPSAEIPLSEPTISPSPETPPSSKFNFKTVLIIIGGIIVAAGIGYGVFYLVSSLGQSPQVNIPQTENQLPVATPTTTQSVTATNTQSLGVPVVAPLVHASLIFNPTRKETLTLTDTSLQSFEAATASSNKEQLIVGSVKDLEFVDASGTPIDSSSVFGAYFAPQAPTLSSLFEPDFTSWLYYDKTGGAKLGMIFQLKPTITVNQASSTVTAVLEGMTSNISTFFVSNSIVPTDTLFKDGVVSGVPVRFLIYSLKNTDAFEYGWYSVGNNNYLIMGTSYNQMIDIIKRLSTALVVPPTTPISTGTSPTTNPIQ